MPSLTKKYLMGIGQGPASDKKREFQTFLSQRQVETVPGLIDTIVQCHSNDSGSFEDAYVNLLSWFRDATMKRRGGSLEEAVGWGIIRANARNALDVVKDMCRNQKSVAEPKKQNPTYGHTTPVKKRKYPRNPTLSIKRHRKKDVERSKSKPKAGLPRTS